MIAITKHETHSYYVIILNEWSFECGFPPEMAEGGSNEVDEVMDG